MWVKEVYVNYSTHLRLQEVDGGMLKITDEDADPKQSITLIVDELAEIIEVVKLMGWDLPNVIR